MQVLNFARESTQFKHLYSHKFIFNLLVPQIFRQSFVFISFCLHVFQQLFHLYLQRPLTPTSLPSTAKRLDY